MPLDMKQLVSEIQKRSAAIAEAREELKKARMFPNNEHEIKMLQARVERLRLDAQKAIDQISGK